MLKGVASVSFVVVVLCSVFGADGALSCTNRPGFPKPKLPITDYERDGPDGRALCVKAVITQKYLDKGEATDDKARRYCIRMGAIKNVTNPDEAGHLIARRLGGTKDTYNIVPQNGNCNKGRLWKSGVETVIYNLAKSHTVTFIVKPVYSGSNNRPVALQYEYYVDGTLSGANTVPNPIPPPGCT
uniref:Type VII secretion system protein EssD-like domain-containing protein n=1 Tax=Lygus hesperus TaxID=30085 RepID=A0A146LX08_LYGHE